MDIEDIAVGITKIDKKTYQWPQDLLPKVLKLLSSLVEKLFFWHSQLRHLNFITLRIYLKKLHINFLDNILWEFVCKLCKLFKAKKTV